MYIQTTTAFILQRIQAAQLISQSPRVRIRIRNSDQIIGIRFYAGSDFFFPDTMLDLIKENFPELVCHCEPVTDVTGVAIPIDTQNGH